MTPLVLLPCLDSDERAARCREVLLIPRDRAAQLGRTAVTTAETRVYRDAAGGLVDWRNAVARAQSAKRSLAPDAQLPDTGPARFPQARVQVANETTLVAARRLTDAGKRVLALSFASGVHPGGAERGCEEADNPNVHGTVPPRKMKRLFHRKDAQSSGDGNLAEGGSRSKRSPRQTRTMRTRPGSRR
jgi:hypothetical protein